jgi:hypothetical protein
MLCSKKAMRLGIRSTIQERYIKLSFKEKGESDVWGIIDLENAVRWLE